MRRVGSQLSRWIREFLLILGIGVLGSQVLITINDGQPLGMKAQAASMQKIHAVQIVDLDIQTDPGSPNLVKSISFLAQLPGSSNPETVKVEVATDRSNTVYLCDFVGGNQWVCQTHGLKISELSGIRAFGNA